MRFLFPRSGERIMLSSQVIIPIIMCDANKAFIEAHKDQPTNHPCVLEGDTLNVPFRAGYILQVVSYSVGMSLDEGVKFKCENELTFVVKPEVASHFDFEIRQCTPKAFFLQNRYQDGGWENLGEEFAELADALHAAASHATDSIRYGMVRVIKRNKHDYSLPGSVILEIPAGGFA
jgi:hypothetical protein